MELEIRRRIRDNLYGSIDVSTLENEVIAHPVFQRLRRIRQTAFLNLVFPGASHSRLEHSLGVMHLAGLAWAKLKDNQIRVRNFCTRYRNFAEREKQRGHRDSVQGLLEPTFSEIEKIFSSPYVLQTLRLGALLHDLGHPPFSHSGERFLPSWKSLFDENPQVPQYLKKYMERHVDKDKDRVTHEVLTILLLDQLLNDIYFKTPYISVKVAPQDIASIIIPEIEPKEGSELTKSSALYICRELISGEIDLDRMDYLRRDAKECGVAYGFFDVDRVLDSLALYASPDDGRIHLALQYSGLPAFEDYLRARQSMYVQLYFHKTTTACEAMMQKISTYLKGWNFPAKLSEYSALDEHEIRSCFLEASKERLKRGDQQAFEKLIRDLLVNRRLWKMVYEITEEDSPRSKSLNLEELTQCLKDESIEFETVSSRNVLTKFRGRKRGEKSPNYLRLIKSDERQFLRIEAVEDYSSIIKEATVLFQRIYVSQDDANEAKSVIRAVLDS